MHFFVIFLKKLPSHRYAHQARSIVNDAHVNEDPNVVLIRALRAEIEKMRALYGAATPNVNEIPFNRKKRKERKRGKKRKKERENKAPKKKKITLPFFHFSLSLSDRHG